MIYYFSRLLLALIMLEHQCSSQKGEEINSTMSPIPCSPTRASNLIGNTLTLKYVSGAAIPQQPMFLASILSALQLVCYFNIYCSNQF